MQNKPSGRKIIFFILSLVPAITVLILVRLAIHYPDQVERYYSKGLYPIIANILSFISRKVYFSLWDSLWISIILLVIAGLVLVFFKTIKLKWFLLRLLQFSLLFYSLFYILWGFNYFRPALETRLGWHKMKPDEQMFRTVMDTLISQANSAYTQINTSEYFEIENSIEESYRKNGYLVGIDYYGSLRKPKKMMLSFYFLKSGISGYFGPFFNEVQMNSYQLPIEYPFILAHERAHQFGIASEDEASLTAYIICAGSDDPRLKYSGNLYLLLYFLNDAKELTDYKQYLKKISEPVMADIMFREEYYDILRNNRLEKMQDAANDLFLKSNNISKGIKNYDQVVGLIISWYRQSGLYQIKLSGGVDGLPGK